MQTSILLVVGITALTQIGGLAGGALLIWKEKLAHRVSTLLVSFAAGTLLSVAFLDVLPELAKEAKHINDVFTFTLVGILIFFVIEKLLLWHHHAHNEEEVAETDEHDDHLDAPAVRGKHIRPLILFGDGLHNFLDGVTLAITFSIDWKLGLLTAIAVFFHEVPHNISDFAVLLHTRMPRRDVMKWNFVLALPSPIGALLAALTISKIEWLLTPLLGIAAGSFLYIALADLIPEIHHEKRSGRIVLQVGLLLVGVLLLLGVGKVFGQG